MVIIPWSLANSASSPSEGSFKIRFLIFLLFSRISYSPTLEEKPVLHYYIGTFVMEKKALEYIPEQIINWADGKGLVAFFKILMALNKLYAYPHEGHDVTFNTIEELNAAEEGFLKFYTHFQ